MNKVSSLTLRRLAIIVLIGEYLSLRVQHNLLVFSLVVVYGYIDNSPQQSARLQTSHATAHSSSKQCDTLITKCIENVCVDMHYMYVSTYKNVLCRKFTQIIRIANCNNIMPTQTHPHQVEASKNHRDVEVFFVRLL